MNDVKNIVVFGAAGAIGKEFVSQLQKLNRRFEGKKHSVKWPMFKSSKSKNFSNLSLEFSQSFLTASYL